ncbi:C39 family peptidase [Candidatus Kaiserbacteria bacterium]|nr:C39 family peptidase [Candidatus Kaiserbacteria bacterium]
MAKRTFIGIFVGVLAFSGYTLWSESRTIQAGGGAQEETASADTSGSDETAETPSKKTIEGLAHAWQSFNNCSSVGLMVALSHWDILDSQEGIAEATRPWNNPSGNNDDKSVTLYELAAYAEGEHGLVSFVRPNGTIELLKKFIANDIPVVARTLTYADKDMVHYRVVRGYDDEAGVIIESDGINGPKFSVSYDDWMHLWKDYNYSYLIAVPSEKKALVERILGSERDERAAWQNAKARAESGLSKNPSDIFAHYNLVTALYYLGDYEDTVREFEKIESRLTRRVLWYQHEPIDAYFRLGNYDRVLVLTDGVINDNNKSVSELYVLRGKVFESRGDTAAARAEYEKALLYNKHLQSAKDALAALP